MGNTKRSTYEHSTQEPVAVTRAKQSLAALPPDQLSQVLEYGSFLRATGGPGKAKDVVHEVLMYDALCQAVAAATHSVPAPFPVFQKSQAYALFRRFVGETDAFLGTEVPIMSRVLRAKAYRLFSGLLVSQFTAYGNLPLTMPLLLRRQMPPGLLFDMAFPGYARSGMVAKVLEMNRAVH